jgi:nitronate monooxygenase
LLTLGLIGGGFDLAPGSAHLSRVDTELADARARLALGDGLSATAVPVGLGFITTHASTVHFEESVVPLLIKHRPLALWLFAPHPDTKPHAKIIPAARAAGASWGLKVFVQVGNVAAAREAALDGADVLVAQGIDAGGHQFRQGAGVISLVPEIVEMLIEEGKAADVAVVAAGGIVDGRGVAAAWALGIPLYSHIDCQKWVINEKIPTGAEGVAMGTRVSKTKRSVMRGHYTDRLICCCSSL